MIARSPTATTIRPLSKLARYIPPHVHSTPVSTHSQPISTPSACHTRHFTNTASRKVPSSLKKPTYIHPFPVPSPPSSPPEHLIPLADQLHYALTNNTQLPRPSQLTPPIHLDSRSGYTTSQILSSLRSKSRAVPVGRKIGFTNTNIWTEYNVSEPNWGYVWDDTVFDISAGATTTITTSTKIASERTSSVEHEAECDLSSMSNLQPRLEPELVLGLRCASNTTANTASDTSKRPGLGLSSTMSDAELLSHVDWIAPGFEIVVSPYENWAFTGPETTAVNALHGRLLIGDRVFLNRDAGHDTDSVLIQLETFTVELCKHGERGRVDSGTGRNVLGSPIKALRFLVEVLEGQEKDAQSGYDAGVGLRAGEVVTTGTLTRAWPIAAGETWEMTVSGLEGVEGLRCRFGM